MFKKIVASVLLASYLLVSFVPTVQAQGEEGKWWKPTYQDFNSKVNQDGIDSEIFGERYTHAQVYWIAYSLASLIAGGRALDCAAEHPQDFIAFAGCVVQPGEEEGDAGAILPLASLIDGFLYTRPASGINYLANAASNLRLVPEAKAQEIRGFGFRTLEPVQSLWVAARNVSYALMTVAVVILAFMIMFRMKLSPQTTITIASALPKIIIALILITFSYAIAGLLVDLAFLVQGIIATMVSTTGLSGIESPTDIFLKMNNPAEGVVAFGVLTVGYILILGVLVTIVAGGLTVGTAAPPVSIGSAVLVLLVFIVFLIALVRMFWTLLRTYVVVLLQIIAVPFYIIFGVVAPSGGFSTWLKSMVANLSVFVTVGLLVILAHILVWSSAPPEIAGLVEDILPGSVSEISSINPYFINPQGQIGSTAMFPSFGGIPTWAIGFFAGLVVILGIPGIANMIKDYIATGRAAPFGMGGEILGGAIGLGVLGHGARRLSEGQIPILEGIPFVGRAASQALGDRLPPSIRRIMGSIYGAGQRYRRWE